MKKIIFLVVISIFFSVDVCAYDYTIDNYSIDMVVQKNNSFDVTEKVTVQYFRAIRGFNLNIPINNNAKIEKIKVNDSFEEDLKKDYLELKIGSKNNMVSGTKDYSINYSYVAGTDENKGKDVFYFKLMDDKFSVPLNSFNFNIAMPKKFDKSKIKFLNANNDKIPSDDVTYSVNDSTISGEINNASSYLDGLIIRIELNDGYFSKYNPIYIAGYILPALLILIIIVFYLQYKKGNNRSELFKKDLLTSLENRDMK